MIKKRIELLTSELFLPWAVLLLVILVSHLAFGGFFPSPAGIGHDFSIGFPVMLSEYYWARSEGNFAAPWFTPAFCGGIPLFADPGSMFYAFPSLLVRLLVIDPLTASYVTFQLFVGVGFVGMYVFSRRTLLLSLPASIVSATLFAFNGFFIQRFIIGHIGFHGIMLTPWLAFLINSRVSNATLLSAASVLPVVGGSLILAYWVHSGAQSLIVAFGLAAAVLSLIAWIRGYSIRHGLLRAALIIAAGAAVSASKLTAVFTYMQQFPRSDYRLPGFSSLIDAVYVLALALFANKTDISGVAMTRMQNLQWTLDRHEWEFGVSWVPLALLIIAAIFWLGRLKDNSHVAAFDGLERRKLWALCLVLVAILAIPIVINVYSPFWNTLLKSVPLIGSSSSLVRWFVIWVPFMTVVSAILVDATSPQPAVRFTLSIVCLIAFFAQVTSVDRSFYAAQSYSPSLVTEAFHNARGDQSFKPKINQINVFADSNGNIQIPLNRNDLMVFGASQLACYMPIFGYQLENFPQKSLHVGSTYDETNGELNVKNPACFVFPKENFCNVGDHFPISRREDAEKFLSYRAFSFEKSVAQKLADLTTLVSLIALFLATIASVGYGARKHFIRA